MNRRDFFGYSLIVLADGAQAQTSPAQADQFERIAPRGASFAANTYAAPIYAYTGQWAYFDTRLATADGGAVSLTEEGYVVNRDARSYLWLADRASNRRYSRPDYFLCFWYQDLKTVVYRFRRVPFGCSFAGVVEGAAGGKGLTVADSIAAQDKSGRDSWAIVRLDWSILDRTGRADRAGAGGE